MRVRVRVVREVSCERECESEGGCACETAGEGKVRVMVRIGARVQVRDMIRVGGLETCRAVSRQPFHRSRLIFSALASCRALRSAAVPRTTWGRGGSNAEKVI